MIKRFSNDWSDEFEREVITDHHDSDYEMLEKETCELLNELYEENNELKTKIFFIIDNRIRVYQKYIKKCEPMLKLNDDVKQYTDLFNAKVEELEQLKKELLEVLG